MGFEGTVSYDEFGIPIKSEAEEVAVDEFGIPIKKKEETEPPMVAVEPQEVPLEETMVAASPSQDGASVSTEPEVTDVDYDVDPGAERLLSLFKEEQPTDEVFDESELLKAPKEKPVQDQLEREALDVAGLEDVPTSEEFKFEEVERKRIQSASNESMFGINEPDENLRDYTEVPAPDYVKNNEDVKTYLSSQIGSVNREVNQVMSNPEAFGFPERILSANEEDIQGLIDEMWASNAPRTDQEDWTHGKSINLEESKFRNVARESINGFIEKYNVEKNNKLNNQSIEYFLGQGASQEQAEKNQFANAVSQALPTMSADKKALYEINKELRSVRDEMASLFKPPKLEIKKIDRDSGGELTMAQKEFKINKESEELAKIRETLKTQEEVDDFNERVDALNVLSTSYVKEAEAEQKRQQDLQKQTSSKMLELNGKFNTLLGEAEAARKKLGEDKKALVNLRTGAHVDKLDDNSMDLGPAIEEAKDRLTYEDNIEDVFVKASLAANEHMKYGLDTKRDIKIPLSDFDSRAAINYLESKGYKRKSAGNRVVGFDGVSLSDMSNFSVRGSINEELAEEAERWLDRNIDLTVDRVASSDMALLNLDPGGYEKNKYARFKEIVDSEFAPKGYDVGYVSDVKLVDSSIAQLRDHGIELTKEQEENAKRSLGLEVTEGVAGFVPVMVELAVLNKVVGAAKVVTGVGEMIGTLKSGNKIQRGLAVLMDATIEEGTMQAAGFKPGTGFGFSIAGKGLSKLGLDKLPFKFKGELARLNKSADMLWSNGIKGVTATEFAGNVEAAIADLEGGETMKNYLDQNYKDLSQVGRRALVNMFVFQMIGGGELVGKGKGGFNIRRMEEARNELQRKGHNEEASEIDNYINHYYEGKKGKTKNASYNDLREAVFENLRTNKESTLTVESMDKVPEQFRDRVEEVPAVEGEVDVTFLGIPTGKKKKVEGKTSYSYKVSGKEMADLFFERKGNKSDKDFEGEYNQKRYEDKEQDQKEEGTTEPTETSVVKVTKEPEVFTTPTEKKYASVNRNDGKGEVTLTKPEYEAELARQFAESKKEQLELGEGTPKELSPKQKETAAPKEDAPVDIASEELLRDVDESPEKYGYHGGTLGGKSDELTMGYEGEQPFTGHYFYGDRGRAELRGDRSKTDNKEARAVDFSKYNLIKPTTEGYWVLKSGVKKIWNNLLKGREIDSEIERIESFIPEVGKKLRENIDSIDGWLDEWQAIKDKNFATRDYAKSKTERFETFLLKKLGYEGVDVRGLKEKDGDGSPDKGAEGSVIFDLKEGTVVDITPKPKKAEVKEEAADVPKAESKEDAPKLSKANPEDLDKGKQEVTDVKEGTITTENPIKIYKGMFGKKNPDGTVRSAHPDVEGSFGAVDKKLATRYTKEDAPVEFEIPAGVTIEVVNVPKGQGLSKVRAAETKAINESDAQIVKLITFDARGREEQFIIKDKSLIEEVSTTEVKLEVPKIEPPTKEEAKSEEEVVEEPVAEEKTEVKKQEEIDETASKKQGEPDLIKELVKTSMTKDEKKRVSKEENIDESEVESKVEEEVKNQINDKTEKEPKTLLQRIAAKIRKTLTALLILANSINISGVKAPTAKSKAYDNIKVENLQSFDKMYMDQEAVNKKNNIDIIRKSQANKNENYIIVDKATGSAHLFKGENLITSYEVGVGRTPGDIETKLKSIYIDGKTGKQVPISVATKLHSNGIRYVKDGYSSRTNWNEGTRTTGAGIFTINKVVKYKGKDAFYLNTEQGISTEMALHKPSNVHRSVLMSDGNPDNNRITNGCVNFQYADLSDLVKRGLTSGGDVYVLPDNPNNVFKLVDGELRFQSADPKVNRTTASTKPFQAQPITLKAKGVSQPGKEFLLGISENKADIMALYPTISNDLYNRMAKVAYGIFGQESSFGTYGGPRGKAGGVKDRIQAELERRGVDDFTVLGKQIKASDASVGVTQIRFSSVNKKVKEKFEIETTQDLFNMQKSSAATMSVLLDIYANEIPSSMKEDFEKLLPLAWSNRTDFAKAKKGDQSVFKNKYLDNVSKNAEGLEVYMGENPIIKESATATSEKAPTTPTEGGGVPIEMVLPLLFAGAGKKRRNNIRVKGKEAKGVLETWMKDVQKRFEGDTTEGTKKSKKSKALSGATESLMSSDALKRLDANQRAEVLSKIESESKNLVPDLPVSILSETKGLTIKQQFKQGFDEYVNSSKIKEKTARDEAKSKANKQITSLKEKLKDASKSVKDNNEARKLFNDITKDLVKEFGLSEVSKSKFNKIMTRAKDVDKSNVEGLLSEVFDVIESEFKRNLAKEAGVKEKAFVGRIKAAKFGTLTEAAKQLSSVSAGDIPLSLMPRYVDLMTALAKPKPSAKDLSDLSEFMSDYKIEIDRKLKDIQHFADVRENFYNQRETDIGKWKEYLEEQGYSESDVDFATTPENLKQIKIARKSFYGNAPFEGNEMSPEEKVFKVAERIKAATKMFLGMRTTGEASVDMNKYRDQAQGSINVAQFFNDLKPTDIQYLTPSEAESLPVIYANINAGMVTGWMSKIMHRVGGERLLDSFVDSPIKRTDASVKQVKPLAKNKGVIVLPEKTFKSVVSTASDLKKIQKERRRTSGEDEIDFVSSIGDATKIAAKVQNEILDYVDEVIPTLKGKPLYTQLSKVIRPLASVNRETAEIYDELTKMFGKMKGNPLFNSTLMSLYFRAREYENNPNKDVNKNPIEYIDATIRSEKTPSDKRIVLKEMKEEYFVKGNPKTQMMRLELDKRRGGKVIDYMDDVMSNFAPDVRFMAEVEAGKSFDFVFNYQPRATIESGSKPLNEVLNSIGPGSRKPSLKTSAIEDRKTQANALTFDAFDDFMRTVSSVHMQRDVAPAMNEISAFISAARRSGNDDAITFASILEQTVKGYVEGSLSKQYTERNYLGNLGVKIGSKMKRNILSGITKPIVEGTIQVAKLAIDADANAGFMEYLDKAPKEHTNKEVLSVLKSVHAHRAGILSAEMARERSYLADQVRRGTANTAEKMMYKLASNPVAKGVTGTDKLLGEFNTALIKAPDLMGRLPQVVLGATSLKFKEITGKNIDFDKVASDPLYRAKYKDALDLAISYGDQIGTRLSGPGAMEQRSIADIKAMGLLNQPLNRFVRSFSTNESNQIQSAVATIAPVSTKINRKERGAEFDNKKKAARGFAASMVGLAGYKLARIVGGALVYALADALLSDDDDELFEDWDWEEVSAMLAADAIWTSIAGKYGVVESLVVQSLIVNGIISAAEGTDQEERVNKIADAMFYSTVDSKTPFGLAVGSLGAEGKSLAAMLELGSIISEGEFDTGQYSTRRALYANYMWFGNIPGQQDLGKILKKRWRDQSINMKWNQAMGRVEDVDKKISKEPERVMMKLYEKTGDRTIIPSIVKDVKRVTVRGVPFNLYLNQARVNRLQKIKGDYVRHAVREAMRTPRFENASDAEKIKILKDARKDWGTNEVMKRFSKYNSLVEFYEDQQVKLAPVKD